MRPRCATPSVSTSHIRSILRCWPSTTRVGSIQFTDIINKTLLALLPLVPTVCLTMTHPMAGSNRLRLRPSFSQVYTKNI
ncbi:hypothetical protein HYQ45_001564 [Verticillium longisporum]|uniref:Uncharacterized protein n=1 Tax=Verticillium longisporum TaxID=100787 RepID=A0A8I3A011_VERLO|nr:hypothetical protein HYQ45_001564 [Verticillium longisporum]